MSDIVGWSRCFTPQCIKVSYLPRLNQPCHYEPIYGYAELICQASPIRSPSDLLCGDGLANRLRLSLHGKRSANGALLKIMQTPLPDPGNTPVSSAWDFVAKLTRNALLQVARPACHGPHFRSSDNRAQSPCCNPQSLLPNRYTQYHPGRVDKQRKGQNHTRSWLCNKAVWQ